MTQLQNSFRKNYCFLICQLWRFAPPKICAREYYTVKIFGVSNQYTLNLQGFFNLYFLFVYLSKDYLFVLSRGKNTDGGRASSDENKLDFPDPKQEVQQQYFLVYRDDMKLCPKSVQRCEQCRLDFSSPDFLVIKTVGIRERTEKWGEKKI